MNFEFSEESNLLRDQARSFLSDKCGSAVVRRVLEGKAPYAETLWREMAVMGWMGVAIPEQYGGIGFGYEALCVLAEELGRALAPVPYSSSVFLAAEAILAAGTEAQKTALLPSIADGSSIGALAFAGGLARPSAEALQMHAEDAVLNGEIWPVQDGNLANFAIVAARDSFGVGLYAVDLNAAGVQRQTLETFDPSRGQARFKFTRVSGDRLGAEQDCWPLVERVLERAAIVTAFEQVGGAEACLHMARDYSLERIAFGRQLGSFQAIKHKLADVYVELEIARANAYYGAWALQGEEDELPLAAATARVAAIQAFRLAAKENIQTHGGVGFTWEFDCHLFYRRAQVLALALGGMPYWKNHMLDCLVTG